MKLKKLGTVLVVVAALGAVFASSAFAAATTEDMVWITGAAPGAELSGSAEAKSKQIGTSTFETVSGGFNIKLHSTNIECLECKLENSGGTAVGSGKLKFTGVTVQEPATCSVASSIATTKLSVKADYMIGTADYILFEPAAGSTTAFATIELTGASCPIKTAIIPKGTLFVKAQNKTEVQAVEQKVNSSAAINTEAGGTLHVGEEPASLTGEAAFELTSGAAIGIGPRKEFSITANETDPNVRGPIEFTITKLVGEPTVKSPLGIQFGPPGHPKWVEIGGVAACERKYTAAKPTCKFTMEYLGGGETLDAEVISITNSRTSTSVDGT